MEIISASEAKSQGLKRYFTGKPCGYGHVSERYVSKGTCVTCTISRAKARYEENTDKIRSEVKRRYEENRDEINHKRKKYRAEKVNEIRAINRVNYLKNREKAISNATRWRRDNPEKRAVIVRRHGASRRAKRLNKAPSWHMELTKLVLHEALALAALREHETGIKWHVDHMLPLQGRTVSGLHVWNNLQVIPALMNLNKRNRLILTEPGQWLRTGKRKTSKAKVTG